MPAPKNTDDKRIHAAFTAQAGKGRPKGVPNKATSQIKDMIIKALDKAGGVDYLVAQAEENPGPFMTLVGKVIPLQVGSDPDNPITQRHVFELSDEALMAIAAKSR